ncbi:MAG TPA: hypothetical protein VNG13_03235 [Mycobacteriales bacterium]|nr:hypothetical protein [Mycobacteriales bacterium]
MTPRLRPGPLRRPVVAAWALLVAGLGLALALLGPPPPPPPGLGPRTVLAAMRQRLPAAAADIRVAELLGWQVDGRWRFTGTFVYRSGRGLVKVSVTLPAPLDPAAAVFPWPGRVTDAGAWPLSRVEARLARDSPSATTVTFEA